MILPKEVTSYFLEMSVKAHRARSASTDPKPTKGLRSRMDLMARDMD